MRCPAITRALVIGLLSAALPGLAHAARIVDVRVGRHAEFTRIVLELDGAAGYEISRVQGRDTTEVIVDVAASTKAVALGRQSELVESVRVSPRGDKAEARIRVSSAGFEVDDMTLSKPSRIVIDLRPAAKAAPKAAPTAKAVPTPEPPAQATAPPPVPHAGAKPAPTTPTPTPEAEAEAEAPTPAPPPRAAAPSPAKPEAPPAPAAEAPQSAPPAARKPVAATPAGGGDGGSVLLDPRLLGTLAAVIILLLIWLRLRRTARERSEEVDVLSQFPPEEPPAPLEPSGALPPPAGPAASEGIEVPPEEPLLPGLIDEPQGAAPVSNDPGEPSLRELERRIQHLETRLEEAADARERVERQLAAHTEELRVQRSAIARAQRVLRSIARPEGADS